MALLFIVTDVKLLQRTNALLAMVIEFTLLPMATDAKLLQKENVLSQTSIVLPRIVMEASSEQP